MGIFLILLKVKQETNAFYFLYISSFQVKGTVFKVDANGALVDITAKSSAYLPVEEASIHNIKHVEEAGIFPGFREEFVIIGKNEADDSVVLSLRSIQYDIAWERCRQLQDEDVVVKGKVCIGFQIMCLFNSLPTVLQLKNINVLTDIVACQKLQILSYGLTSVPLDDTAGGWCK